VKIAQCEMCLYVIRIFTAESFQMIGIHRQMKVICEDGYVDVDSVQRERVREKTSDTPA
jgi:hypothetical protein